MVCEYSIFDDFWKIHHRFQYICWYNWPIIWKISGKISPCFLIILCNFLGTVKGLNDCFLFLNNSLLNFHLDINNNTNNVKQTRCNYCATLDEKQRHIGMIFLFISNIIIQWRGTRYCLYQKVCRTETSKKFFNLCSFLWLN